MRIWAVTGLLTAMAAMAGCAEDPNAAGARAQVAPALTPTTTPPATAFNWGSGASAPAIAPPAAQTGPHGETLNDDPSAPPNTPLCGTQAREINAMASAVVPVAAGSAGICATYACYDPLTATYIGADGARHVCRIAS